MGDTVKHCRVDDKVVILESKIKKTLHMQRNNGLFFVVVFLPNTNIDCAWMKISNKQSRASIQRSSCSPHTCGSQSRCAGDSDTLTAAEPPPASSLPKWQCMVWRTAVHLDTRSPANEATSSSNYWICMGSALNSCTPWHMFTCKWGNVELKLLLRQGKCAWCEAPLYTPTPAKGATWSSDYW